MSLSTAGRRRQVGAIREMPSSSARKTRKKITLTDIARRAGVSVAAVSLALAERPGIGADTRDRIVRLSRALGYVPRRAIGGLPSPAPAVREAAAPGARKRVALAMVCPEHKLKLEITWLQFVIQIGERLNCKFEIEA